MEKGILEIKEILEQYILYLEIGAFRQLSVKNDIALCRRIISETDEVFRSIHSKRIKNIYREHASICREVLFSEIDIGSNAIIKCEKVLENPSYENCKQLDYTLNKIYSNDEYGGVRAQDEEQEKIHREMYRNIKNKLIALNLVDKKEQ